MAGSVTFRYADHEEVYEAGDAYYAPPRHVPVITAGTEIIEFSPSGEYERTMEVVGRNLAALQASSSLTACLSCCSTRRASAASGNVGEGRPAALRDIP